MRLSVRWVFFLGFFLCALMLAIAGYFQFVENLEPCPLCILSRVAVLAIGGVFLVAALHNPKSWGIKVYALLGFVVTLIGIGITGRHVWLQSLPAEQVPACGPGLNFMLDNFPLTETLELVFRGSGECAEVQWGFLGLTIPGWTLVAFLFLGVISLWQMGRTGSSGAGKLT